MLRGNIYVTILWLMIGLFHRVKLGAKKSIRAVGHSRRFGIAAAADRDGFAAPFRTAQ